MDKNILYYPTIEFNMADYGWLWRAALLWDKIYRIVPDGYSLNEPRNIQELCSTGEIGIPLCPRRYSATASKKFIEKLESRDWQAAALEFNIDDIEKYEQYTRLHKDKVDVSLRNLMLLNPETFEDNDWIYVSKEISNQYMIYLATEIAKSNNLSLNTHNPDVWTASTFFINDGKVQEGFFPSSHYIESSQAALAPVFINNIFPDNILDITPQQIIEFRSKRKDERKQFQQAFDLFCDKLSQATDPKILNQIWEDEKKEIEYALTQYKKSMDILKTVKWGGYVTSLITIATDVLGYTDFNSNVIQGVTSAGIGIGLLTGVLEKKFSPRPTPYSYLSEACALVPNRFKDYNYFLYRKMEVFIND